MVSIIDCGIGNIGSILNMLRYLGIKSEIIKTQEEVRVAEKIILPGVGSWDNGITKLKESQLLEVLSFKVFDQNTPILGICLGMQLLCNTSEEGKLPGLGWISGCVKKFQLDHLNLQNRKLSVPHMGWNTIKSKRLTKLNLNLASDTRFYFVHSYYMECENDDDAFMTCHYGEEFVCAVNKKNIWGVQFHPEKSHKFGMQLMRNFAEL